MTDRYEMIEKVPSLREWVSGNGRPKREDGDLVLHIQARGPSGKSVVFDGDFKPDDVESGTSAKAVELILSMDFKQRGLKSVTVTLMRRKGDGYEVIPEVEQTPAQAALVRTAITA